MNPKQVAGLALVAFGVTEVALCQGRAAKSFKTSAIDKRTTPLIFGRYAVVVALFFLQQFPGPVLSNVAQWLAVGVAVTGGACAGGP